jgi:hypothetical protein
MVNTLTFGFDFCQALFQPVEPHTLFFNLVFLHRGLTILNSNDVHPGWHGHVAEPSGVTDRVDHLQPRQCAAVLY